MRPKFYVWDFWYLVENDTFYVFFLFSDYLFSLNDQHHFNSRVGFSKTSNNFVSVVRMFDELSDGGFICALEANKEGRDNTSIWTGDVVKLGSSCYHLFYTSRDKRHDFFSQKIFLAKTRSLESAKWEKKPNQLIEADGFFYADSGDEADLSIHAWRDPYVFWADNELCMAVTAKVNKGYQDIKFRGCVGLLIYDFSLRQWIHQKPLFYNGAFSECEVPEVLLNGDGDRVVTFSCWQKNINKDLLDGSLISGGLYEYNLENGSLGVLVSEDSGLYACRVVPELSAAVGFRINGGGLAVEQRECFSGYKKLSPHDWS